MAVLTLDLIKHSEPTPADAMAPQIITVCGNFTLDLSNLDSVHSSSKLWDLFISKQNAKFTFFWKKKTLDHWAMIESLFSLGKTLLMLCLVHKWFDGRNETLVAHFLYTAVLSG